MGAEVNGRPIGVEILGTPRTVRMEGTWRGMRHSAPLECWIVALIETLAPEQKDKFFEILEIARVKREGLQHSAIVVADIPMPQVR